MQLDPNVVILDAVLTEKGRELLATGDPNFQITYFALFDDEVDYGLYDQGANDANKGDYIKNMPLLEPSTDTSLGGRYKLITLPKGTTRVPVLSVSPDTITLKENQSFTIDPQVINYNLQSGEQLSFTCVLRNNDLGVLEVLEQTEDSNTSAGAAYIDPSDVGKVQIAVGRRFRFTAASDVSWISSNARSTSIEIFGNVVGGSDSITVTVQHIEIAAS